MQKNKKIFFQNILHLTSALSHQIFPPPPMTDDSDDKGVIYLGEM
jgi:hypothetical protein